MKHAHGNGPEVVERPDGIDLRNINLANRYANEDGSGQKTSIVCVFFILPIGLLCIDTNSHQILVIAAGFTVTSMTCSLVFGYGVYQALYEELAKEKNTPFTGASSAIIALIGVLAVALMTMGGPWAILWAKLFSPQAVVCAGGLVFGIAFILASFSQSLWQFVLTQGLLAGIGTCMSYVPTTAAVPGWFDKHRGLAMGIVVSGTGVGGTIWPPILRTLITHVGFRNAMRVSGSISALLVVIAGAALRWEPKFADRIRIETQNFNKQATWLTQIPTVDLRVASSKKFIAMAVGNFLQSAGYSTPLFFYAAYAEALGYGHNTAAIFITISNASNFISRILIGYAADRMGRLNALLATTIMTAIAVFGFWLPSTACKIPACGVKADVLFIFFAIMYGAFASAYISLFPASLLELFGQQHYASVNGSLSFVRGLGALLGTPLTGLLVQQATALTLPNTYERAIIVVGVLMFCTALSTAWVRVELTPGSNWMWKA